MCEKICFFINSLRGGGAERVCVTLANELYKRGWNVELLVLNLDNAVLRGDLDENIALTCLNTKHAGTSIFKLAKYLNHTKPSKILVFNRQLAVLLVIIRKLLNLKTTVTARNITTLSLAKRHQQSLWHKYIIDSMVKFFYAGVDKVIAQSIGMKNDLIKCYRIKERKITVIYNPLNNLIGSFADKFDFDNIKKQDYLLCVGRLEPQKGFSYAIKAFARIADQYPQLRLKIVGQGSQKKELEQLANDFGINERVDFEGYQQDMVSYYLYAKATVLTSLFEGFPNVLVESISLGTPVVAFDCPSGPSEIVQNGINGYLVHYEDDDHLVCCLQNALAHDWNILNIRNTSKRYDTESIVSNYESVLSS